MTSTAWPLLPSEFLVIPQLLKVFHHLKFNITVSQTHLVIYTDYIAELLSRLNILIALNV